MSLISIDLKGLSKPATKLIEAVGSAIGVLYEPRRIRKEAQANADAKKIALLADIELTDIQERALQRTLKSAARKQENIESITMQAALQMDDADVNVEDNISEDWIVHFFDQCENISDADMQSIWSKILAGEAKNKGSYSKRTINFLSSLDKKDAELITRFGQYVWQSSNPSPILLQDVEYMVAYSGMSFSDFLHLESIGFINMSMGYTLNFAGNLGVISYFNKAVQFDFSKRPQSPKHSINTGSVVLTTIGREIIPMCGATPNFNYFYDCIKVWRSEKDLIVKIFSDGIEEIN